MSETPIAAKGEKNATIIEINRAWETFSSLIGDLKNKIREIGSVVAWLLDNDPGAREMFRRLGLDRFTVNRFAKVGRGTLLPELACNYGGLFDKFPTDQQKKVLHEKVEAVIREANGTYATIMVDVLDADPTLLMRVLASDHIRTPSEQRQYIERCTKAIPMAATAGSTQETWRVLRGGKLEVAGPCVFTRSQLLSILKSMD